jgi:hypothetical protein
MEKAGDLLKKLLIRQNLSPDEPRVALFQGWAQLVEPPLADHSRVVDLRNHLLLIEVDHPGWMQILHLRQSQLLKQVRKRYPQLQIRGLSLRVNLQMGGEEKREEAGRPMPGEGEPGSAEYEEARQVVSRVQEPELRDLLSRLFIRVIERARRKEGG